MNADYDLAVDAEVFARMWEAFGCARLIVTGPELAPARALVTHFATERETTWAGVRLHGAAAQGARRGHNRSNLRSAEGPLWGNPTPEAVLCDVGVIWKLCS